MLSLTTITIASDLTLDALIAGAPPVLLLHEFAEPVHC